MMIINPRPTYEELRVYGSLAYVGQSERQRIMNLPKPQRVIELNRLEDEIRKLKAQRERY